MNIKEQKTWLVCKSKYSEFSNDYIDCLDIISRCNSEDEAKTLVKEWCEFNDECFIIPAIHIIRKSQYE